MVRCFDVQTLAKKKKGNQSYISLIKPFKVWKVLALILSFVRIVDVLLYIYFCIHFFKKD